jgi:hypothetical protein
MVKEARVKKEAVQRQELEKMKKQQEEQDTATLKNIYKGTILAGKHTPYIEFNTADYATAQKEGKLIILVFFTNESPADKQEESDLKTGFNTLASDNTVGFRVNYHDADTDQAEQQLAQKYGIVSDHTKVIIKNGIVVIKDTQPWTSKTLITQAIKAL